MHHCHSYGVFHGGLNRRNCCFLELGCSEFIDFRFSATKDIDEEACCKRSRERWTVDIVKRNMGIYVRALNSFKEEKVIHIMRKWNHLICPGIADTLDSPFFAEGTLLYKDAAS